jgi:hypothetical protein
MGLSPASVSGDEHIHLYLYYIKWLEVMDAWQYVVTLHFSSTAVKKIE